ncbi:hypothetical protein PMAYCL1PPCAC_05523, partial [Pristionchus mayeri]
MEEVKKWMRGLRAVQHLHLNGVIHRNLHPGNICIDFNGKLVIRGFGRARVMDRDQAMTLDNFTHSYSPIELLLEWEGPYDGKVDIWSVATLLCQLITGHNIFGSPNNRNPLVKHKELCGPVPQSVL